MMARTDASATYADTISLRFTGEEANPDDDATDRRRRQTSSSRTVRKDWTWRSLKSSMLSCRHPSP